MKLEYHYTEKGFSELKQLLIGMLFVTVLVFSIFIYDGVCNLFDGLVIIAGVTVLFKFALDTIPSFEARKKGEIQRAEIVNAKRKWRKNRYVNSIEIACENKIKKIHSMKYNKAFYILKLLLDEGKIIPIDIYTYKNKVYADLDSLDLTKINGYDIAEKNATNWQNVWW